MSKAKKILEQFNKFNEEDNFQVGDFVLYISQTGDPRYNCFAKIKSIDEDEVVLNILCKADGNPDISNVADEDEEKIVKIHTIKPGKEILDKKVETAKMKLATLEQLQKEI